MKTLITALLVAAAGAAAFTARPGGPVFETRGGDLLVFPGDSLDIASATFTIDGDTVDREIFFRLDRNDIQRLTVTPAPANLIEVVTRQAARRPLDPAELPEDVDYVVDGKIVDRAAFTAIPSRKIKAIAIRRGPHPRIELTTR